MKNILPRGAVTEFLAPTEWADGRLELLAADASFRRYFRVFKNGNTAVLMDGPPEKEDSKPFLAVAEYLKNNHMSAPQIYVANLELGFVLQEDFGDDRLGPYLTEKPCEEYALYKQAISVLAQLQSCVPPSDMPYSASDKAGSIALPAYNATEFIREVRLMLEWFLPATGIVLTAGAELAFEAAWMECLSTVLIEAQQSPVMVLRDYHADNLMVVKNATPKLGLIDFQDALCGHPAYDVASLLQDIRRDVSPELESTMLDVYINHAPHRLQIKSAASFECSYHILGAQRNTKIIGIFTRLCKRDGKPRYLGYLPKLWCLLERSLAQPALAPVSAWFDQHVPTSCRKSLSA